MLFRSGHLVFDAIKDLNVAAIGGLTFGADPIAVATAFASELNQKPINAFSIRKTRKDHGIVRWIEGDVKPGDSFAGMQTKAKEKSYPFKYLFDEGQKVYPDFGMGGVWIESKHK